MELRHLRYFLSLADQPQVDRAAKSCGMTASVFLKHIDDLEESLGCSLFRRKGGKVSLSAPGQVFYQRAKDLLASAAAAAGEVRATAQAAANAIRLGHSGLWWMKRYAAALAQFKRDKPALQLHPIEEFPAELPGALRRGEIDMALMEHVDVALRIEFKVRRVEALPALIAVPKHHRLAARRKLSLKDLAEEVWLGWDERLFPGRRHLLLDAAEEARFRPCISLDVESELALYDAVLAGNGIGFIGHEPAGEMPEGVVLIPLKPAVIEFPLFLAWRKDAENLASLEALATLLLGSHLPAPAAG